MLFAAAAAFLAVSLALKFTLGLPFRQAALYAPFKLAWRIDDRKASILRNTDTPVIYAVSHRSKIDPALMLALLPEQTLHILDDYSAKASWLEPWRELGRTIAFNTEHVFVSRRLVRHLRGKGRLAVYLPDAAEPGTKEFRLFRAVARIALKADARIVPVVVGGARHLPMSLTPAAHAPRRWFPELRLAVLDPMTVTEMMERAGLQQSTPSSALFDRVAEARVAAANPSRTIFEAIRDAALRFGPERDIIEDVVYGKMSYRRMLIAARILASRFSTVDQPGEAIGLLLPNTNAMAAAFLGLQSAGRLTAMINYTSGCASVASSIRSATIRTVISSRAFVEKAEIQTLVGAVENAGAKILWLEDLRDETSLLSKALGFLMWRRPLVAREPTQAAVLLFTSGSEGTPKGVVLSHRNVLSNAMQAEARLTLTPDDSLLNVLPTFHSFGLTAGMVLPLLIGVRLFLYPSPLHYKLIPEVSGKLKPTILVGTDTFLNGYARTAEDSDFSSLRLVVAGAEAVREETRGVWRERFGAEIVEGFGLTEASPVVAVNTASHGRDGTVGRLFPGMRMRLEPVEGMDDCGRMFVAGPNIMMGYMTAEQPGVLQPLVDGWHDTGDIVSVDRDGFITIRGRAKRFAKVGGEMVSLGAVEVLVQALWPEEHHAVVSVPDKRKGERIVLITTEIAADAKALRAYGKKAGIAGLAIPDDIVTIETMPLLGSGKTDYPEAQRIAINKLGADSGP
ncbi:AMP-binding protein [Mesorhizobium sp. NBSH29]|nr:AMP-binding protein [Mesorhizobium sp. NBSH29]QPC88672.1 AMP-binding protein [Mesorhizobium sp. NBSH29]